MTSTRSSPSARRVNGATLKRSGRGAGVAIMWSRGWTRTLLLLGLSSLGVVACTKADPPGPDRACQKHDPSMPLPRPSQNPITVVQHDPGASAPFKLAVQACAGLQNRRVGGSVYVESDPRDAIWLDELDLSPAATVSASAFLTSCVASIPDCVRYDYRAQQPLLPNILTVAAAVGAVPLDTGLDVSCGSVVFDAIDVLKDRSPAQATQYVFDNYGDETTGLAMLNPGYDQNPAVASSPALNGDMRPELVDFVFSQKLFVVFLVNGCIDGNPEKAVLGSIVNAGRWPTPLGVYGYNNAWMVGGGYLFEAQTRCLDSRNMGAIASEAPNLSFFSTRAPPITESDVVTQNAPQDVTYDPAMTYVAFVVGDGDNIQYMLTTRRDWFQLRLAACESTPDACPALTWSISSHLTRVAPEILDWYYAQSHKTGKDYFILPPSGHLYAYPSSLADAEQDRFVQATQRDACLLGLTGTVHWDWMDTWHDAEDYFLPKYATAGSEIRGVFPMNVPYSVPTFTWWSDDRFYELLTGADGGHVALFRPRSWRGVNNDADPYFLGPAKMAEELGGYPKGTVSWVYMTSDGGLTLENSFAAVAKLLPPHVKLVSADMAAKLALAAGQGK